jgi:hypothetical protein
METLVIELTNSKAYKLLQDMEELNLIRVIKQPVKISLLRSRVKTKMSNAHINNQINSIRNEWQSDI